MLICIASFFTRSSDLADVPGAEIDGVSVVAAWRHLQAIFNDRKVVPVVDIEYLKHVLGDQVASLPPFHSRPSASAPPLSTSPPSPPPPPSRRPNSPPSMNCHSSNSSPTFPRANAENPPLETRPKNEQNALVGGNPHRESGASGNGRPSMMHQKSDPSPTSGPGR